MIVFLLFIPALDFIQVLCKNALLTELMPQNRHPIPAMTPVFNPHTANQTPAIVYKSPTR